MLTCTNSLHAHCIPSSTPFRAAAQMTDYRVIVTGLPPSASWQDLKDHMRKAGEPTYTDVVSYRPEETRCRATVD